MFESCLGFYENKFSIVVEESCPDWKSYDFAFDSYTLRKSVKAIQQRSTCRGVTQSKIALRAKLLEYLDNELKQRPWAAEIATKENFHERTFFRERNPFTKVHERDRTFVVS